MITFLSATPGSGKSLLATETLYDLSRSNIKNLKFNHFYAKAFFEKINTLGLNSYLKSITLKIGQGLEQTTELIFLESDYFDFLNVEYQINVVLSDYSDLEVNFPAFYYERISILNSIIDLLKDNEKTSFEHFKPVRTIYTNIASLRLSQPRSLPENCDWRLTPQGSYFVIDEAQLIPIFSEEARSIDPIVKDLTIHRHKGYDFLFITQDPSFVNKYIRKLSSLHIHLINIFGWEQSMKLEWTIVQEAPNAVRSMSRAENITRWRFPKHIYSLYKSSTIHTRKKRIPKKLVFLIILGCVFILLALMLFSSGNSTFFRFLSGQSPLDLEVKQNVENTKDTNTSDKLPDSKNLSVADIQEKNETSSSDPYSFDSASSVASSEPVYNPNSPYDFIPVSTPPVVNHRVFSGCAKWKGVHYAYDQQGTKLETFSESDCKRIVKESSNRPFDYFNKRDNPPPPPPQPVQEPSNIDNQQPNYKVIDGVLYLPVPEINKAGGVPATKNIQNQESSSSDYNSVYNSKTNL